MRFLLSVALVCMVLESAISHATPNKDNKRDEAPENGLSLKELVQFTLSGLFNLTHLTLNPQRCATPSTILNSSQQGARTPANDLQTKIQKATGLLSDITRWVDAKNKEVSKAEKNGLPPAVFPQLSPNSISTFVKSIENNKTFWIESHAFPIVQRIRVSGLIPRYINVEIHEESGHLFCLFKDSVLGRGASKTYQLHVDCENWIAGASPRVNTEKIEKKCGLSWKREYDSLEQCKIALHNRALSGIQKEIDTFLALKGSFEELPYGFPNFLHLNSKQMIMEFYPDTLSTFLKRTAYQHPVSYMEPIINGVAYLNSELHRVSGDIKPDNILISKPNSTKSPDSVHSTLTDFDLSFPFSDASKKSGIHGTPGYIAPEIINKQVRYEYADRIDSYPFGLILLQSYLSSKAGEKISGNYSNLPGYSECRSVHHHALSLTECYISEIKNYIDFKQKTSRYSTLEQYLAAALRSDPSKRLTTTELRDAYQYLKEKTQTMVKQVTSFPEKELAELSPLGLNNPLFQDLGRTIKTKGAPPDNAPYSLYAVPDPLIEGHFQIGISFYTQSESDPHTYIRVKKLLDVEPTHKAVNKEIEYLKQLKFFQ